MDFYSPERVAKRTAKRIKNSRTKTRSRDVLIVKKRLEGKSIKEIAKEVSLETGKKVLPQVVDYTLNRDDIQGMLDRQYCKMASALPEATDNIINAAKDFSKEQESEDKKISWEASKLIAQAHGLLPTSNQSVIHQTYINQQNNTIIPPVIAELAAKHFGGFANIPKAIDVEVSNAGQLQENAE